MKKAIIIHKDNYYIFDSLIDDAIGFGKVLTKYTILFDSITKAKNFIKEHKCSKRVKIYTLNKKQEFYLNELKNMNNSKYIEFKNFINIK